MWNTLTIEVSCFGVLVFEYVSFSVGVLGQQIIQRAAGETKHCAKSGERVNHQIPNIALCMLKLAFHFICSHISLFALLNWRRQSTMTRRRQLILRFTPHQAHDWSRCETAVRWAPRCLPKRARPNYMHAHHADETWRFLQIPSPATGAWSSHHNASAGRSGCPATIILRGTGLGPENSKSQHFQ